MSGSQTAFAGLEVLQPGDPLSTDGYALQSKNPVISDKLLKVGAVTHRHDAHAAMANPTLAPTVLAAATGGTIDNDVTVFATYTLIDADGGESAPIGAVAVTTGSGFVDPSAPTAAISFAAGTLLANTYLYAVSVTDGLGGETVLGPWATVQVPSSANAEVALSGLTAITNTSSSNDASAGWRLWRSTDGGNTWDLMATGAAATDAWTDNGSSPGDCSVTPQATGTTGSANSVTVTVPGGQPAAAQFFNVYADDAGVFATPSLFGTFPIADAGTGQVITSLSNMQAGSPPTVTNSLPGANQIDPDTDILGWPWKKPVATVAALPTVGNSDGDMRIVLANYTLYVWEAASSTWVAPLASALAGTTAAEKPVDAVGSALAHTGVGQVIGGVTITAGMRVLDTANATTAGIWVTAAGAWTRPTDFATGSNAQGKLVESDAGAVWLCIGAAAIVVDTGTQTWVQVDSSVIQNGSGLSKTGNTLALALTKALVTATGLTYSDVSAAPIAENVNVVAASGAAQAIPDVTVARMSRIVLSVACTLTFPAAAAGKRFRLQGVQPAAGGPLAFTWPAANLAWVAGVAPTQATAASKRDLYEFECFDGANWEGRQLSPAGGY
jgi:hypothetical protein